MRKTKSAKRSKMKKTTVKHQTTQHGVLTLAEKVEKEFRAIPSKLAKLYRQELMTLKHQATKLKADLKKAQLQLKVSHKKQSVLAKAKSKTATAKKQLVTAKKASVLATKTVKDLTTKLTQITKTCAALFAKQTKYTALNKQLAILEKQAMKTAKVKKTVKKTVKKAKNKLNSKIERNVALHETPTVIANTTESVEIN